MYQRPYLAPHQLCDLVDAGAIAPSDEVVLLGPTAPQRVLNNAASVVSRLLELIERLPALLYGGNVEQFITALGFEPATAALIGFDDLSASATFARGDFVVTSRGLRLLEINVGGSVGGLIATSLAAIAQGDQPFAPLHCWARWVASRVALDATGALVSHVGATPAMQRRGQWMADALENSGCQRVLVCSADQLTNGDVGADLRHTSERVGWIYPRYMATTAMSWSADFEPINAAVRHGAVHSVLPVAHNLLSSKITLALLWSICEQSILTSDERRLVEGWIPRTHLLTLETAELASSNRDAWVLKPAQGYGGTGVLIGQNSDRDTWTEAIRDCLGQQESYYVLQELCPPVSDRVVTCHPTGEPMSKEVAGVWGVFVCNGVRCGDVSYRCQDSAHGVPIVNAGNGAACGVVSEGRP